MTSVAESVANVLRTRESLDYSEDFITARDDIANFRYSLLDESDRLPQLSGLLPEYIKTSQEIYADLGNECLKWIWDCQGHLNNPKSEQGYRERSIRDFPGIQKKVQEFYEKRKPFFPCEELPEAAPIVRKPPETQQEPVEHKRSPSAKSAPILQGITFDETNSYQIGKFTISSGSDYDSGSDDDFA